jgi:hypothetical protein
MSLDSCEHAQQLWLNVCDRIVYGGTAEQYFCAILCDLLEADCLGGLSIRVHDGGRGQAL